MKTITIKTAQSSTGKWYIVPRRGDIATILCSSLNCTFNESTQPELLEKTIDFCFNQGEDPAEVARNLCSFFIHNQLREFELKEFELKRGSP